MSFTLETRCHNTLSLHSEVKRLSDQAWHTDLLSLTHRSFLTGHDWCLSYLRHTQLVGIYTYRIKKKGKRKIGYAPFLCCWRYEVRSGNISDRISVHDATNYLWDYPFISFSPPRTSSLLGINISVALGWPLHPQFYPSRESISAGALLSANVGWCIWNWMQVSMDGII